MPSREDVYQYMIHNFEKMIDGDKIPHFDIGYVSYEVKKYITDILNNYSTDIQKELGIWLRKEKEENRLFIRENWKSFRDNCEITDMFVYLGYNKLFQYKQYYFQLVAETDINIKREINTCYETGCIYCKQCKENEEFGWFELALYGWKDDEMEKLQPKNKVIIPPSNIMPLRDWNRIY